MSLIQTAQMFASQENQDKGKKKKKGNKPVVKHENTKKEDVEVLKKIGENAKYAKSDEEALRMHQQGDSVWNRVLFHDYKNKKN